MRRFCCVHIFPSSCVWLDVARCGWRMLQDASLLFAVTPWALLSHCGAMGKRESSARVDSFKDITYNIHATQCVCVCIVCGRVTLSAVEFSIAAMNECMRWCWWWMRIQRWHTICIGRRSLALLKCTQTRHKNERTDLRLCVCCYATWILSMTCALRRIHSTHTHTYETRGAHTPTHVRMHSALLVVCVRIRNDSGLLMSLSRALRLLLPAHASLKLHCKHRISVHMDGIDFLRLSFRKSLRLICAQVQVQYSRWPQSVFCTYLPLAWFLSKAYIVIRGRHECAAQVCSWIDGLPTLQFKAAIKLLPTQVHRLQSIGE